MTKGRVPRLVIVLVVFVSALAVGVTTTVWATHIDNLVPTNNYDHECDEGSVNGGGRVCRTDNRDVSYYMDSNDPLMLEQEDREVITNVMNSQFHTTVLDVDLTGYVDSGCCETDIVYQEGDVPGSDDGITWCNDDSPDPRYECDQQFVRIQGGATTRRA